MKYYLQFDGNEKLFIKFILVGLIIVVGLLGKIAFEERPVIPIYTYFNEKALLKIIKNNMHCPVCHGEE